MISVRGIVSLRFIAPVDTPHGKTEHGRTFSVVSPFHVLPPIADRGQPHPRPGCGQNPPPMLATSPIHS